MRVFTHLLLIALSTTHTLAAPTDPLDRRLIVYMTCNASQAGSWICDPENKYAAMCPVGGGTTQAMSVVPGDWRCIPAPQPTPTVFSTRTVTSVPPRTLTSVVVITPTVTAAPE
ncbi:hypothetical protein PMZ80_002444 [Knufia obscura]|uniref:Uncharacterized protein n=2 Tax=Knufia TaxID=430999 RepID=A0AAN8EHC8_9EURO|nr:hypothetical protein PMZ80_002444 [Knufia obscura]KAK5950847.1 hypothetical protein OHC33_008230 [Knufia fluminis]